MQKLVNIDGYGTPYGSHRGLSQHKRHSHTMEYHRDNVSVPHSSSEIGEMVSSPVSVGDLSGIWDLYTIWGQEYAIYK